MDIITIAQREADTAAEQAQTPEVQYDAYRETIEETLKRGRKAEEILEAGLVSKNGSPGSYYVQSQNGSGRYTVDVDAQVCDCRDRANRPWLCKHLQAAELYQEARDPLTEAGGEQVVLEVEGYARGKQVLDKRLKCVRINGGSYREPKSSDYEAALDWLAGQGYDLAQTVKPKRTAGTVTVRYIHRKGEPAQSHDDAIVARSGSRRSDRLFKGE